MPKIEMFINGIQMASVKDYEQCDKCDDKGRLPAVEGPSGIPYRPFCACEWGKAQKELNK